MSLKLEHICYTYGEGTRFAQPALLDVSLEVAPGEMVLVLGATGSGKSTLLRIASGLVEPSEGATTVDSEAFTRQNTRGVVGLVFQDAESQLFADTILEDVAFGPRNLGVSAPDAETVSREALAAVGLDPEVYGSRSPFTLSGGEARRAAIAGVLAMRPRYLLADEPTAGLDASGRKALRTLLLDARANAGVVVVSHAADEFLGFADRVLVLEAGRCAWYGSADELIANPETLVSHGLVPPDVLEVQRLAAGQGLDVGRFTLDPVAAASALAIAGGWL